MSGRKDLLSVLTTIDRDAIIAQLRANTKPTTDVVTDNNETITVDLTALVSDMKGAKPSEEITSETKIFEFGSNSIQLDLEVPTLDRDVKINQIFTGKIKSQLAKNKKNPGKDSEKLLSEIYFVEICKYISQLTITTDDDSTVITFNDAENLQQNLKLVNKLPSSVVSGTTGFITKVKEYRDSYLYYVDPKTDEQVSLDVDANMFTGI